jgi:RNA polymerase sigma factor (sigma-70 family)
MRKKIEFKFSSFRKGDQEALKILHEEFYVSVLYFARSFVKRIDVADDIVMEAFEEMWNQRKRFKDKKEVKAFLYIAVRNACLTHIKKESNHETKHKDMLFQSGQKEDPAYLAEKYQLEMIRAEVIEYLNKEIRQFPMQMRKIFELRLKKNCKYAVIARRLKTTVGTVRYQLHEGCARLKEKPGLRKRWMLLRTLMRYE